MKNFKAFSFIIVAGGSGSRMRGGERKQFRLLNGRPVWRWSADTAAQASAQGDRGIGEIILVLPKENFNNFDFNEDSNLQWPGESVLLRAVPGGASRAESVLNGLLAASCDYAMVHDAARPFVSGALLCRLMDATSGTAGAVPLLPVADAIKRVDKQENENNENNSDRISVVERDGLFITQTPQSFHREMLIRVLERQKEKGDLQNMKDEAEAWLDAKLELRHVEGERLNFKITWPEDLLMAQALAGTRKEQEEREEQGEPERVSPAPLFRTGLGYDVHRLVPERPLILGGVRIESSPLGLLGHSDADLLTHAVMDALLGAAGLPDIGNLFPASDERYRGADSLKLLKVVVSKVLHGGWRIEWVDAVIQAQVPKLNAFLPEMKKRLSEILNPGSPGGCVNIKAKSAEKTGDPGAGGSMTCWASATLRKI